MLMRVKLVAGLAVLLSALPALAQEPKLLAPGIVTYGTAATFPPFQYVENGTIIGFSVDHMEALAKKLGLKPQVVNMEFPGLIPALQSGRFDIINSAVRITEERKGQVDFIPYMRVGTNIVVRTGNPKGIKARADMCGKIAAVELGSAIEQMAREDAKSCEGQGKPTVTVLTFPGRNEATIAVRQGRADAFYDTTPAAVRATQVAPDAFAIVGDTFAFAENGIAVRKGDTAIKAMIEKAQAELVKDGTFAALLKKHGFPAELALP